MPTTRRDFLRTGLTATALAGSGIAGAMWVPKKLASDWVTLGDSGVKVTRLAFGTGTFSGRVQRDLGQDAFTRLIRHAYDRGIRFFDTGESYSGTPQMLSIALKGLPRDSYRLMTKWDVGSNQDAQARVDRMCRCFAPTMGASTWIRRTSAIPTSSATSSRWWRAPGKSTRRARA